MASKIPFSVVAISLFIGLALATVDEEVGTIDFGYSGENGPSDWSRLKPAYSACSGKNQSPINIIQKNTVLNQNMQLHSKEYNEVVNATLINWGHIIALHYNGHVGWMEINGTKYTFKQMHWHTPSEHLINGRRYAAELHLVHEAEDRSAAVIAILYRYSNSPAEFDPFLVKLGQAFQKLSKEKSDKEHVRFISKQQVEALKAPLMPGYKDNARPKQPLNGRQIVVHDEIHHRIMKNKRTNI
ncbi:hypothetical protein EZV62_016084 [Acer yangbiense]|uniref:Carbonic anhydrase n=1 Tax=Acer yangbiense TaxID=1000413 RepID=A0A5C7HNE4_9ROSI|nr:hypothetical protein EZV62_016084 [Acer yangbiense]